MFVKMILVGLSTFALQAFAGDNGGGHIECESASGRTKISGAAGANYNGWGNAKLTYQIDAAAIVLDPNVLVSTGPSIHLVDFVRFEPKKFYSATIKRSRASSDANDASVYSETIFELTSVGGSMREVRDDVFVFKALVPQNTTIDPRQSTDIGAESLTLFDKDIEVNCTLDVTL